MAVDPLDEWIEIDVDPVEKAELEAIAKARSVDLDAIVRDALALFIASQR